MTLRTITFDDEQWQVVPKKRTVEMCRAVYVTAHDWDAILAVAPEPPDADEEVMRGIAARYFADRAALEPPVVPFDRARFEAGEMPRTRDGREVVALVWDGNVGCWRGFVKVSDGRLLHASWPESGAGLDSGEQDQDLVHERRVQSVRTVWYRHRIGNGVIYSDVRPEGWTPPEHIKVLHEETIEVPV